MAYSIFRIGIRNLPGNQGASVAESSARKEGPSMSIFGSAVDKQKNYGRGMGSARWGFSSRLAECRPSVKTPPTTKPVSA